MKLLASDTIRRCFIADPGHLIISADFDQIELRLAAAFSGEKKLIDAAKKGESLHKIAAVELFGPDYTPDQYRYTKNVNFGWLFGGGAKTLSEQAGITYAQANAIIKKYGTSFPDLSAYKRREQEAIYRQAFTAQEYQAYRRLRSRMFELRSDTPDGKDARANIGREIKRLCAGKYAYATTITGRRIIVDAETAYAVVNYKIQSAARDIMASALLRVMDDPELEPTVLLPIHDELLGQARKRHAERVAKRYGEVMSTSIEGVPLTASGKVYGRSWGHGYVRN